MFGPETNISPPQMEHAQDYENYRNAGDFVNEVLAEYTLVCPQDQIFNYAEKVADNVDGDAG
jgi:hypothetical protein